MATDIFRDPTKALPKSDEQIVRVPLDQMDVGGRKSHLPSNVKSDRLGISHVPNAGSKH